MFAYSIYLIRPGSRLGEATIETTETNTLVITFIVLVITILVCILPMSLSTPWNTESSISYGTDIRQYETLAESILDGRIDLEYEDLDPRLLEMENPYDPNARSEEGVQYHWDHAFYKGKYYMYFGIVPVFLLFLPYRLLTGSSLPTHHATQIFTAAFIIGVFMLFSALVKRYFRRLPLSVYLVLSTTVSIMSTWYFADAPSLYCTAISAGICMEIWSLFFFLQILSHDQTYNKNFLNTFLGSLFGALAFGCRPPVALVNCFTLPYFIYYTIRSHRLSWKQIFLAFSPYAFIGILLMLYNFVRFENPFEFGQSYQLTIADQSQYSNLFERIDFSTIRNGLLENFISYRPLGRSFPYINHQSVFMNFPIFLIAMICLTQQKTLKAMKKSKQLIPVLGLMASCILITVVQILQAALLLERYRSDIYWIVGIIIFLSFGFFLGTLSKKNRGWISFTVSVLGILTILQCFFLWAVPWNGNFTQTYPEYLEFFARVLSFG